MTIVANIYDKLQTSYAFQSNFKIGDELLSSWEWPAKNYGGKFMRRIRFPYKFKYLNKSVSKLMASSQLFARYR